LGQVPTLEAREVLLLALALPKQQRAGADIMTLWDLMTALCFVMPLAGALATLRDVQNGWLGYGLASVIGLVIGGLCVWAMRAVGSYFATRSSAGSETLRPWYFRALYVAAAVWIIVALFLGSWVTAAFIRYI
jgi:hypothetical protein